MADYTNHYSGSVNVFKNIFDRVFKKKKKPTYKPYTNEELLRIENVSRLPASMQKTYYTSHPAIRKKVVKNTSEAIKSMPNVVYGAAEYLNPIKTKTMLEGVTHSKIDTGNKEKTAGYQVGKVAGLMGQYAMTGGGAAGAVSKSLYGGAKLAGKIGAGALSNALISAPVNTLTSAQDSENRKDFGKNMAINTALDLGSGAVFAGVPAIVKALKGKKPVEITPTATKNTIDRIVKGKKLANTITKPLSKNELDSAVAKVAPQATPEEVKIVSDAVAPQVDKELKSVEPKIDQEVAKQISADIKGSEPQIGSNISAPVVGYKQDSKELAEKFNQKMKKYEKPIISKNEVQNDSTIYAPIGGKVTSPVVGTKQNIEELSKKMDEMVKNNTKPIEPVEPAPIGKEIKSPIVGYRQDMDELAKKIDETMTKMDNFPKYSAEKWENTTNKVLTETPTKKSSSTIDWLKNSGKEIQRKFVSSLAPFERIAKNTDDAALSQRLTNSIDAVRKADNRAKYTLLKEQQDFNLEPVGESADAIFKDAEKIDWQAFNNYIQLKHNVDTWKAGTPTFKDISPRESAEVAKQILNQYPEFASLEQRLQKFYHNNLQLKVDSGQITQETADAWEKTFPNYSPTFRDVTDVVHETPLHEGKPKAVKIFDRKGGTRDVLDLREQAAISVSETWKGATLNDLMGKVGEIFNTAQAKDGVSYLDPAKIDKFDFDKVVSFDNGKYWINFMDKGKPARVFVDKDMFDGIKEYLNPVRATSEVGKAVEGGIRKATTMFKSLITEYNPMFTVFNFSRDMADGALNSKNVAEFYRAMFSGQAAKAAVDQNSFYRKWFESSGTRFSNLFDYQAEKDSRTWFGKTVLSKIGDVNIFVETVPRMSEFIGTIRTELKNQLGYVPKDIENYVTKDMIEKASRNASEITVDFGRNGQFSKYLNSVGVPFFNPAMQGFSRLARLFAPEKSARTFKYYSGLAGKIAAFGIAPSVLNELFYANDKDYQSLRNRDKDLYFLFKVSDGNFLRIPKGRVLSVISTPFQEGVRTAMGNGHSTAGELANIAVNQVGPINPVSNNLAAPIVEGLYFNRNWMGMPIEDYSDQKKNIQDRWDESTSEIGKIFSKYVGKFIGISPKETDYIISSYTGIIGQVILPITTKSLTMGRDPLTGIVSRKFEIDPTYQNKLSNDFYTALSEAEKQKNSTGTLEDELYFRYFNKISGTIGDLKAKEKEIQLSDLSNEEKSAQLETLQNKINAWYDSGLMGYSNFQTFLQDSGMPGSLTSKGEKDTYFNETFIKAQVKAGGNEWKAYTQFMKGNKADYKKVEKTGISAKDYYNAFKDVDQDGNGAIAGWEAYDKLESTNLTRKQKAALWNKYNSGWKQNPYTSDYVPPHPDGTTTASSGSSSGGSGKHSSSSSHHSTSSSSAKRYSDGLATKQVKKLQTLNLTNDGLSQAEVKAIIKLLARK